MNWIMGTVKSLCWDVVSEYVFFENTLRSFKFLFASGFLHESKNSTEGSDYICLVTIITPAVSEVSVI